MGYRLSARDGFRLSAEAVERANTEQVHGEDAVVVGRETSPGGAVTVAIALRPTQPPTRIGTPSS